MDYLIDGHNLIGAMPDISLADPDDEDQLIERLKGYMGRKRNRCTVVFDNGMLGGLSPELSSSRIKVYFAPNRTEADAIIRSRIRKADNPRNLLVISSDREIIAEARRWGAETMSSQTRAAATQTGRRCRGKTRTVAGRRSRHRGSVPARRRRQGKRLGQR